MNATAPDTWLTRARDAHRADLARDGMPQQRHERWRSMPMRELVRAPVAGATTPAESTFSLPGEGVRVGFGPAWHAFDVAGAVQRFFGAGHSALFAHKRRHRRLPGDELSLLRPPQPQR